MVDRAIEDRIRGVIFGQAIGDALGLATEFLSASQVGTAYGGGVSDYEPMVQDRHRSLWRPGDWTDDTNQMLCILDSLLEVGQLDESDIARRIMHWAQTDGRGLGRTVRDVLMQPDFIDNPSSAAQRVWEQSGKQLAANGAVMRTSVLGVWQYQEPHLVATNAERACKITHWDPRCVASCIAASVAISLMLRGMDDVAQVTENAMESARRVNAAIDAECMDLARNPDLSALKLDEGLNPGEPDRIGYTYKATASAFWALLHCDSFESGVLTVVNAGGDADTNAAVVGALLGARYGYESFPARLTEKLNNKDALEQRVTRLIGYCNA